MADDATPYGYRVSPMPS